MTTTTTRAPVPPRGAASCGLPSDQVHEWLEQVEDDLRKVRARLEYLELEQARLENQQQLLAELVAAAMAV
jgi:septal ring factor EnvC (AmiA/AmiB activator)